ncbi:unnamed protein product [Rotaria sp. Silwood2]|nr:unnamed protein product [Rotaria sp. Silwood2]CAF2981832.1 unnamed protein product [Rotaria sp. Silwood2]CAF4082056.1 unnamed protein product [Rotaria sp. Silwood2]
MVTFRWNSTGITIAGNGTPGVAANEFNYPFILALDSLNTLYIGDLNNSRVQKWASNTWVGTTAAGQANGTSGSSSYYLSKAGGFAVDSSGNVYIADISGTLYIADTLNRRVVRYLAGASSGTIVAGENGVGLNNYQLNYSIGLYFESSSNSLVIANAGANNIVRWVVGANNWTLVIGSSNATIGSTSTMFYYPVTVTFDRYDNIGTTIAGVVGTQGNNATLLKYPYSIILDGNLNLYAGDSGNHRIQNFLRY